MWPQNELHSECTRVGISYTQPRYKVFLALKYHQPCTLNELQERLHDQVDRRTVQRIVKLFISKGIALRPEGSSST